MARDLTIADRLRRAGLKVRETKGWKTRGEATLAARGAVCHHTAGPSTGTAPSLGIIINGRSDLPGPLANVYMDREGTVYVIAAGKANHAGLPDGGECRGMFGNSHAYGLEIEHTGASPLDTKRIELAAKVFAALGKERWPASQVVQHREWAPSRKIDLATSFSTKAQADAFRDRIGREMKTIFQTKTWKVTYTDGKGNPAVDRTRRPGLWSARHAGAFQRGKVVFRRG
jgi:hypothetical protein